MIENECLNHKYQLTRLIGSGGFGDVYEAIDLTLKRAVAIKLLKAEVSSQPVAAERFLKEAQLTSQLTHPNTLNIYDFGKHKDRLFLVSELLNGESLKARLLKVGCYSPQQMVSTFLPICSALHEAHLAGVIHRDLKPDNLFLHQSFDEERLILLDFGIAKTMGDIHLTQTGQVFGTPHYMAPEQIKESKTVDARADIYSLGIIFYEVLSGRQPFSGESLFDIFDQHVRGEIPSLAHRVSPTLSPFDDLLEQMLCKSVEGRLKSAHLVAQSLRALKDLPRVTLGASATMSPENTDFQVPPTDQRELHSIRLNTSQDTEDVDFAFDGIHTPHSTTNFAMVDRHQDELSNSLETLDHQRYGQTLDMTLENEAGDLISVNSAIIPKDISLPIITSGTFSFGQSLMKLSTFFGLFFALFWSHNLYYQDPISTPKSIPNKAVNSASNKAKMAISPLRDDSSKASISLRKKTDAPDGMTEGKTIIHSPPSLASESVMFNSKEDATRHNFASDLTPSSVMIRPPRPPINTINSTPVLLTKKPYKRVQSSSTSSGRPLNRRPARAKNAVLKDSKRVATKRGQSRAFKISFKTSLKGGTNLFKKGQLNSLRLSTQHKGLTSKDVKVIVIPHSLGRFKKQKNVRLKAKPKVIGKLNWLSRGKGIVKVCLSTLCTRYSIDIR